MERANGSDRKEGRYGPTAARDHNELFCSGYADFDDSLGNNCIPWDFHLTNCKVRIWVVEVQLAKCKNEIGDRLESEICYGFTFADGLWTSTPYGSASLDEKHSNVFRIGNRLRTGTDISFEIEGTEMVGKLGSVSHDIRLHGSISW